MVNVILAVAWQALPMSKPRIPHDVTKCCYYDGKQGYGGIKCVAQLVGWMVLRMCAHLYVIVLPVMMITDYKLKLGLPVVAHLSVDY